MQDSGTKRDVVLDEPEEQFVWRDMVLAITPLVADIASGALRPTRDSFPKEFIDSFATRVLGVSRDKLDQTSSFSVWVSIQYDKIKAMPESVFEKPVILAYVGKNKGILNIDGSGPHYVLADGNHRMAKAYLDGRELVDVVVLSAVQSRRYKR
jgi:hypothetical protein